MLIIELFIYAASFLLSTLTLTSYILRDKASPERQKVIIKNLPIMIVATCATVFLFIPNLSFIQEFIGTILWFILPVIIVSSFLSFRQIKNLE